MAVYVDPLMAWPRTKAWPYGWVSHLYADTPEELHALAASIGLRRHWCSDHTQPGSRLLHYDLHAASRGRAVMLGAIEVDRHHGRLFYRTREARQEEKDTLLARTGRARW